MRRNIRGGIGFDLERIGGNVRKPERLPAPDSITLKLPYPYLVSDGDTVLSGDILAQDGGMPILSPMHGKVSISDDGRLTLTCDSDDPCRLSADCLPFGVQTGKGALEITPDEFIERTRRFAIPDGYGSSLADKVERSRGRSYKLALVAFDTEPACGLCRSVAAALTDKMIGGAKIIMAALGIVEGTVVLSRGDVLTSRIGEEVKKTGGGLLDVSLVDPIYPSDEQHLLYYLLCGSELSPRRRSEEAGLLTLTADAAVAVYDAFVLGKPYINPIIYVGGESVKDGGMVEATLFAPISTALDAFSVGKGNTVIENGPMRGRACRPDDPIGRFTRQITVTDRKPAWSDGCIACGRCAAVCPIYLLPSRIAGVEGNGISRKFDKLLSGNFPNTDASLCIGCGCCSFVCPSGISLSSMVAAAASKESEKESEKESVGKDVQSK